VQLLLKVGRNITLRHYVHLTKRPGKLVAQAFMIRSCKNSRIQTVRELMANIFHLKTGNLSWVELRLRLTVRVRAALHGDAVRLFRVGSSDML
jgi:hypothetical protein